MPLEPLTPGATYGFLFERVSGDPYVPSQNVCKLLLDPPNGGARVTKTYNPAGGSDPGATASGDAVVFSFTTQETAAFVAGDWVVTVAIGNPVAVPVPDSESILHVRYLPNGPV